MEKKIRRITEAIPASKEDGFIAVDSKTGKVGFLQNNVLPSDWEALEEEFKDDPVKLGELELQEALDADSVIQMEKWTND
jgi:hypothetical protein